MSDLAHTVEDVKRLAPTTGFYWVGGPQWNVVEMHLGNEGRLWWRCGAPAPIADERMIGCRIIGPLTPPGDQP